MRIRLDHDLFIAAPAERVWEITLAIAGWPTLTSTVSSAEWLGPEPPRIGSRARIVQPRLGSRIWTVSVLDAPHEFAWQTKVGLVRMVGQHKLEAVSGGCRNRLTLEIDGFGSRLLCWLTGRRMMAALAAENEGFKRAAEA